MKLDLASAMIPPPSAEQSEYADKDMGSHCEMMCQVLMQLGRLEAKLDMALAEDEKEEKAGAEFWSPRSASTASDSYLPMDFTTMGA